MGTKENISNRAGDVWGKKKIKKNQGGRIRIHLTSEGWEAQKKKKKKIGSKSSAIPRGAI